MTRAPLTRCRAWALSIALLLAQALGLHHGVVHGARGGQVPDGAAHQLAALAHTDHEAGAFHTDHEAGALHTDHEAGDEQCRLVDQLGHAEGVCWALPAVPVWTSVGPAADGVAQASPTDAVRAPYQARGPP